MFNKKGHILNFIAKAMSTKGEKTQLKDNSEKDNTYR